MKVLVTGGTGFTGSHTVRALVAADHDVRLLARDADKVRRVFEPRGFVPKDVVVGDMTDAAAVDRALTGCDVAMLNVKLLEIAAGAHRYAAAGEMMTWVEFYRLLDRLTGRHIRRVRVPGALLRGAGTVGDLVKRLRDFDLPLTRDTMEFTTRWPDADAERTTRELGICFRDAAETYRDTLVWMYRAGHLTAEHVGELADETRSAHR